MVFPAYPTVFVRARRPASLARRVGRLSPQALKKEEFLSFHQRKYQTFLEMLRRLWKCFTALESALSDGVLRKLTEAGSRMPIATTFRCGKANSNRASFWSSRSEHVQRKLNCTHGLEDLSSCLRTKCSGWTAMSWASRGTVRRNGRHGQHSFYWRTSSIASVHCITKKEGVVSLYWKTRKKKCLFMVCCTEHPAWWGALAMFGIDTSR